jgi:hypothetical protein
MYDVGLFALDAIKLQRIHWQTTKRAPLLSPNPGALPKP